MIKINGYEMKYDGNGGNWLDFLVICDELEKGMDNDDVNDSNSELDNEIKNEISNFISDNILMDKKLMDILIMNSDNELNENIKYLDKDSIKEIFNGLEWLYEII